MKYFFAYRTALRALLPVAIVICMVLTSAGSALAAKGAQVQIGFVGVPPKSNISGIPVPNFQNVLLNITNVRINPKTTASLTAGKWQSIPVPPGLGGAGTAAELQIDLNQSQNVPALYNTAPVREDDYNLAEVTIDSQNPGTLIPDCPTASPIGNNDGCINYPIQLVTGDNLTVAAPSGTTLVSPKKGAVASLLLQVQMTIVSAPTTPGGAYMVNVTLSPLSNALLGVVNGTVNIANPNGSGTSTKHASKLTVTAEVLGTNTPVASAAVQPGSACASNNPCFSLQLPAAGGPTSPDTSDLGFGTSYDIAISGGDNTYAADRLQPLYPNGMITTSEFNVSPGQTLGNITGQVFDGCVAQQPIVGATLTLLVPPDSNPTADCTLEGSCVVVASATTDNTGTYPLPGTIKTPAPFNSVPERGKSKPYIMEISAPGFDNLFMQAVPNTGTNKKTGGTCASIGSSTFGPCIFALQHAFITGVFPINPPLPGQSTLVQVFAEDHDSNNIRSALPMPVSVTSTNTGVVGYTLNVPTTATVSSFDIFEQTIDLYQGVVDPYQGHNIVVVSDVPNAPAACATMTAPTPSETIDCVGHGSITGTVGNPDLGTSVVLEKRDPDGPIDDNEVQITNSIVQNQAPNTPSSNNYQFCAPADTYQVQRFEAAAPVFSETPLMPTATPSPAGDPLTVTVPTPMPINGTTPTATATATPSGSPSATPSATPTVKVTCPTTCSHPLDGSCPGTCNNFSVEQTL